MYKSLVVPHLDYADIIYDAMAEKSAKQLQTLQNVCWQICLNCDKRSDTLICTNKQKWAP